MQQYFLLHQSEAKGAGRDMVRVICTQLREPSYVVGHERHERLKSTRTSES